MAIKPIEFDFQFVLALSVVDFDLCNSVFVNVIKGVDSWQVVENFAVVVARFDFAGDFLSEILGLNFTLHFVNAFCNPLFLRGKILFIVKLYFARICAAWALLVLNQ